MDTSVSMLGPPCIRERIPLVKNCLFMTSMTAEIKNRVTFYIDGFNFYYGIRRARKSDPVWGNFYWIDMV